MTGKWLEINTASEYLDVDLEFLCEQVIRGQIKSTTSDDLLMVEISAFEDTFEELEKDSIQDDIEEEEPSFSEIEELKTRIAWLESEKMSYVQMVNDYKKNFTELQTLQEQLMKVINQQSETIRTLRGYKTVDKDARDMEKQNKSRSFQPITSIWMLLPVIGLLLTAGYEIIKTYELYSLFNIKTVLGF